MHPRGGSSEPNFIILSAAIKKHKMGEAALHRGNIRTSQPAALGSNLTTPEIDLMIFRAQSFEKPLRL